MTDHPLLRVALAAALDHWWNWNEEDDRPRTTHATVVDISPDGVAAALVRFFALGPAADAMEGGLRDQRYLAGEAPCIVCGHEVHEHVAYCAASSEKDGDCECDDD